LTKSHLCGVANLERETLTATESILLYRDPSLQISKLDQAQYEVMMQEKREIADWNRIITATRVVRFYDSFQFEEVARAAKKSKLGMVFTPNKKATIMQKHSSFDSTLVSSFLGNPLTFKDHCVILSRVFGPGNSNKTDHHFGEAVNG
jgi:hypothetical protein